MGLLQITDVPDYWNRNVCLDMKHDRVEINVQGCVQRGVVITYERVPQRIRWLQDAQRIHKTEVADGRD
jgi:hypothetical protein